MLETLYSTGMRRTELLKLQLYDLDRLRGIVTIREGKGRKDRVIPIGERALACCRDFAISPQLADHVRTFLNGKTEGLLFTSHNGRPWRESKVVEKRLNPLLKKLGIKRKGLALNGFRHFNATYMDSKNVPVKVRQTRLGHDDPRVTLGMKNRSGYTHMTGEDDRRVAAMFGDMFSGVLCPAASQADGRAAVGSERTD